MTTTPTEIAAIRDAIKSATPGPWTAISRGRYWHEEEGDVRRNELEDIEEAEFVKPLGDVPTTRGQMYYRDAAYIATVNPTAMTAVLSHIDSVTAERDAAIARAEAAEKDSARYRWLRNSSVGQWEHPIVVLQERRQKDMLYVGPVIGESLDTAIEAALAAKGETT